MRALDQFNKSLIRDFCSWFGIRLQKLLVPPCFIGSGIALFGLLLRQSRAKKDYFPLLMSDWIYGKSVFRVSGIRKCSTTLIYFLDHFMTRLKRKVSSTVRAFSNCLKPNLSLKFNCSTIIVYDNIVY